MALIKSVNFAGFQPEYWVLTHLAWTKAANKTLARFTPFANEAAAADQANALYPASVEIEFAGQLSVAEAYAALNDAAAKQKTADDDAKSPAALSPKDSLAFFATAIQKP